MHPVILRVRFKINLHAGGAGRGRPARRAGPSAVVAFFGPRTDGVPNAAAALGAPRVGLSGDRTRRKLILKRTPI